MEPEGFCDIEPEGFCGVESVRGWMTAEIADR